MLRAVAVLAGALAVVGVLTAPAASATESVAGKAVPTYNVVNGVLDAVDCATASFCMAVGSGEVAHGAQQALAERPVDGVWQRVALPAPSVAQDTALHGIDCVSASFCAAVGDYYSTNFGFRSPLIDLWNGSTWQIAPNQPTQTGEAEERLRSVSCASATFCMAVGDIENQAGTTAATLIEYWDGSSWRVVGSPSPEAYSRLRGIACPTTTVCFAVGTAGNGEDNDEETYGLREMLTPQGWVLEPNATPGASPALPGPRTAGYYGISCTSASFCLDVGWTDHFSSGEDPAVDRWNGTEWASVPVTWNDAASQIDDVSCTSATRCVLLGPTGVKHAQTGTWNGTKVQSDAVIPGSLTGLSCASASDCVAVGTDGTTAVRVFDGAHWLAASSQNPSGDPGSELTAVSCATASVCFALGDEATRTGGRRSVAIRTGPNGPKQFTPPHVLVAGPSLAWSDLSCPTTSFCAAAGAADVAGNYTGLLQTWDGTAWTASPFAPGNPHVACSSATFCLAVDYGSAAMWNGTTWSVAPAPARQSVLEINDIDCVASDDCTAVGSYIVPAKSRREPTVQHWDGSGWTIEKGVKKPAGAELTGIDCVDPDYCVAVGNVNGIYPTPDSALIETWNGAAWVITSHPAAPTSLTSVACGAVGECVAGADMQSTGYRAMYSAGGVWSNEQVFPPLGSIFSIEAELSAVSCGSADRCVGVGSFARAAGPMAMIVDSLYP